MTDEDARKVLETVRQAVDKLITRGMDQPASVNIADAERGPLVVLDIDDHVSDETIAGGRRRTLLRDTTDGTLVVVIQQGRR